ncbi:MAG TPA: hypothetical protein VIS54_04425 [Psychromonas sp.]
MHKLQLIYYPILSGLLLSGNTCAERLHVSEFGDITDNLHLSTVISSSSYFPSDTLNRTDAVNHATEIKIHLEKTANNLLAEHFAPNAVDSLSVNSLMTTLSYRVNEQLSIEGSMIEQIATLKKQQFAGDWDGQERISDADINASFAVQGLYQISDSTQLSAVYNQGSDSNLLLAEKQQEAISLTSRSPQKIALGVQHHINNELALAVNANWQKWSSIDPNYDDIYSAGTAVSYQLKNWTLASAFSIDTALADIENSNPLSAIEAQWNLGFSGTRKINNQLSVGLAYQYQSLSELEINGALGGQYGGPENQQGIHFISTSLSF